MLSFFKLRHKAGLILSLLVLLLTAYTFYSCRAPQATPEQLIRLRLIAQVDSFALNINQLKIAVKRGDIGESKIQQLFLQTRLSYKEMEWAVEYFAPAITRFVNGPPVPEVEMGGQRVLDPAGLQVIETLLYPHYIAKNRAECLKQLAALSARNEQYRLFFRNVDILSWQVFDASKLEVFRILTLGITGFDVPLALNSMPEAAASLTSLHDVIGSYPVPGQLLIQINSASRYLNQHPEFNDFNRAAFIINYGNVISTGINKAKEELHIPLIKYNRLLNQKANTLFDKDAFYVNAYAPSPEFFVTVEKIKLGQKLFSDPALSGNKTRSCASCHKPELAFTDGLKTNTDILNHSPLPRNTPTLLNAGLQPAQFYDLRALRLEEQIRDVVENKKEMHGDMTMVAKRLWKDSTYRKLFSNTFPKVNRTSIDSMEVMNVLSSFLRNLTKLNSRFDDYMRGNKMAMNAEEISGFNLFMGKAKCATCHYMPLFNGTVPPIYLKTESEVIGVPGHVGGHTIDNDLGQYNIIPIAAFKHAFKIPSVRNAALTAPYMHNGEFRDLNEVIDFYNKGGGAATGIAIDNQTLSPDKLHLSPKETDELIAFIKSLNSK